MGAKFPNRINEILRRGRYPDVITHANLVIIGSYVFGWRGAGRISGFPLTFNVVLITLWHYRASVWSVTELFSQKSNTVVEWTCAASSINICVKQPCSSSSVSCNDVTIVVRIILLSKISRRQGSTKHPSLTRQNFTTSDETVEALLSLLYTRNTLQFPADFEKYRTMYSSAALKSHTVSIKSVFCRTVAFAVSTLTSLISRHAEHLTCTKCCSNSHQIQNCSVRLRNDLSDKRTTRTFLETIGGPLVIYTVFQNKRHPFYFYDNFVRCRPI